MNSKTRPCYFPNLDRCQGLLTYYHAQLDTYVNLIEKQNFIILSNSKRYKSSKYITGTAVTGYPTPKRGQNTDAQKTLATYFKPPLDQKESRRKRNHACAILSNSTSLHVTASSALTWNNMVVSFIYDI